MSQKAVTDALADTVHKTGYEEITGNKVFISDYGRTVIGNNGVHVNFPEPEDNPPVSINLGYDGFEMQIDEEGAEEPGPEYIVTVGKYGVKYKKYNGAEWETTLGISSEGSITTESGTINDIVSAVNSKATDNNLVHRTGAEDVQGQKNFKDGILIMDGELTVDNFSDDGTGMQAVGDLYLSSEFEHIHLHDYDRDTDEEREVKDLVGTILLHTNNINSAYKRLDDLEGAISNTYNKNEVDDKNSAMKTYVDDKDLAMKTYVDNIANDIMTIAEVNALFE